MTYKKGLIEKCGLIQLSCWNLPGCKLWKFFSKLQTCPEWKMSKRISFFTFFGVFSANFMRNKPNSQLSRIFFCSLSEHDWAFYMISSSRILFQSSRYYVADCKNSLWLFTHAKVYMLTPLWSITVSSTYPWCNYFGEFNLHDWAQELRNYLKYL